MTEPNLEDELKSLKEWGATVNDTLSNYDELIERDSRLIKIIGGSVAVVAIGLTVTNLTLRNVIKSITLMGQAVGELNGFVKNLPNIAEQAVTVGEPLETTEKLTDKVMEPSDPGPREASESVRRLLEGDGDMAGILREPIEDNVDLGLFE